MTPDKNIPTIKLSMWWPLHIDPALPTIIDVPLAPGRLRYTSADAPRDDDSLVRDEDYVSPPSPIPAHIDLLDKLCSFRILYTSSYHHPALTIILQALPFAVTQCFALHTFGLADIDLLDKLCSVSPALTTILQVLLFAVTQCFALDTFGLAVLIVASLDLQRTLHQSPGRSFSLWHNDTLWGIPIKCQGNNPKSSQHLAITCTRSLFFSKSTEYKSNILSHDSDVEADFYCRTFIAGLASS
ncbi:hypothetical protein F4604DRAFT_1686624 [Suillus subluteus]|nr:hypothetical protein F4604DRAFT_1686624 [Suillus subluteus]